MHISEKIRILRHEKKISQRELGELIEGDARQISLYETKKIYPSSEVIIKLAKVFNVSADYLLFDNAQKRPLILEIDETFDKIQEINSLSKEDKKALFHIVDSLFLKSKFQQLANTQ